VLENGKGLAKLPAIPGPVKKPVTVPAARKKPGRKRREETGKTSVLPAHLDADIVPVKDLQPTVVIEKYAKTAKNPEPAKSSEPEKDSCPEKIPVLDVLSPKYSGPEKNLADPAMPDTFVARVKDPCPAPEPEKIPETESKGS
jgi:hypothetical protein